jgi:hypothetical protein
MSQENRSERSLSRSPSDEPQNLPVVFLCNQEGLRMLANASVELIQKSSTEARQESVVNVRCVEMRNSHTDTTKIDISFGSTDVNAGCIIKEDHGWTPRESPLSPVVTSS